MHARHHSMLAGVAFAVLATLSWALNFISPYVTGQYSIYDLMVLRFMISGVIGGLMLFIYRSQVVRLGIRRSVIAGSLGVLGYLVYSICVVAGVYFGGPIMTPAFIALVPIIVTLLGNFSEKSLPLSKLALPLTLISLGLITVNLVGSEHSAQRGTSWLLGLCFSIAAVMAWVSFSWLNQRLYGNASKDSSVVWTGLMMVGAGLTTAGFVPMLYALGLLKLPELGYGLDLAFALYAWSFVIALMSSVVGAWAWNAASSRLPMSVSGQLIALESLFATMLALAFNGRLPTTMESVGLLAVLLGVILALRVVFSTPPTGCYRASQHDMPQEASTARLCTKKTCTR